MRKAGLWLAVLVVPAWLCRGQITVEVTQEQNYFLPGESMPVGVRITNRSGQTLELGKDEDWLTFAIESREGLVTPKMGDPTVQGEFELPTSKVATKTVDLAPYFPLTQLGRYEVTATVRIPGWDQQVVSKPRLFDIIHGTKLWEQDFGVPNSGSSSNGVPEVRKYVLQQANYLKTQIRLYLRVTDSLGTRAFKVIPIGPMVSFSRPEAQIDQQCNLHVLYQRGPKAFSYTVFDPDGELIARETHDYTETRPRLSIDPNSKISVMGGVRRVAASDIPPPKPAESTDAPAATGILTNPTPAAVNEKPAR